MKKAFFWVLMLMFTIVPAGSVWSAEEAAPAEAAAAPVEAAPVEPAPAVDAAAEQAVLEPELADNLEFISGEVTALDEASKSITVKLYGETEQGAAEKSITVTIDDASDITDGEKDRDLKSLTAGTEVDVEYDSKTNKATYIFVY
ncbi:MAG: hypothetical protein MOGMAGMI_00993 [Candidatus Omnitrophica bacterium]|nr:hypothetical protein [Candidatus Omnitrophota bacterium]